MTILIHIQGLSITNNSIFRNAPEGNNSIKKDVHKDLSIRMTVIITKSWKTGCTSNDRRWVKKTYVHTLEYRVFIKPMM